MTRFSFSLIPRCRMLLCFGMIGLLGGILHATQEAAPQVTSSNSDVADESADAESDDSAVGNAKAGVPESNDSESKADTAKTNNEKTGENGADAKASEFEKERLAELDKRLAVFHEAREELRKQVLNQRVMYVRYVNGVDRTPESREKYYEQRLKSQNQFDATYRASLDVARVGFDEEAITFVLTWIQNRTELDIYNRETLEGAARLIDSGSQFLYLFQSAARSAISVGEFEMAQRIFDAIEEEKKDDVDRTLEHFSEQLEEAFLREKKINEAEADLELPQVLLRTTRGDVLVELYINQAPSTVAHFIGLVEQGFYEDCDFYQVVDHLLALTGDPGATGEGNCGKFLLDEHGKENSRHALRGSLVMAKIPKPKADGQFFPNSASSQFAITFLPMLKLSEEQTIFGRVIEGMDAVCRMRRVDPSKEKKKGEIVLPPDRIIEATVIRRPEKLPEPKYYHITGQ